MHGEAVSEWQSLALCGLVIYRRSPMIWSKHSSAERQEATMDRPEAPTRGEGSLSNQLQSIQNIKRIANPIFCACAPDYCMGR